MTLHTAKGLEYDAVFLTGRRGGPACRTACRRGSRAAPPEERRLFYVGITRARKRLFLSLAMTRAQFGEVSVAMPCRFLQEIRRRLIDWRQSPGEANSRGGTQSRRAERPARIRAGARGAAPARRSCAPLARRSRRRWSASRTASPRRCATTATWNWRPATASGTTTSARVASTR